MSSSLLQISINLSNFNTSIDDLKQRQSCSALRLPRPFNFYPFSRNRTCSFHHDELGITSSGGRLQFLGVLGIGEKEKRNRRRTILVKFNQGPGLNGGGGGGRGGGGGGGVDGKVLSNIAIGVGLIYLSVTGQLGWVLDAIVSVWLLVVILPIIGLGAFFWWAGRNIVESSCPNCGNDFQVFKSTLGDDLKLCPFCSQPFSVVDNEFIPDPVKFYNQPNSFDQAFGDLSEFSQRSKQGKNKSKAIVDVEAEVKDAD